MAEPSLEIQKWVYARLVAAAIPGVLAKVYPRVPAGAALPYLEIGNDQIIGDDEAGNFFECHVEVSAFAATTTEAKTIAGLVYAALNVAPTLTGFTCHEWHYTSTLYRSEIDGSDEFEQAIIEFEYHVQAT